MCSCAVSVSRSSLAAQGCHAVQASMHWLEEASAMAGQRPSRRCQHASRNINVARRPEQRCCLSACSMESCSQAESCYSYYAWGHLFQAVLVVGQVLAIFEGARQNIELLCVCIASLSTQVAGARYTVQAIHTYRQWQADILEPSVT